MKLGICNELFAGWEFSRVCEFCRSLGYSGLELAPFTLPGYFSQLDQADPHSAADALNNVPLHLNASQRQHIRQTANDFELEIIGLHWLLAKTTGFHVTTLDAAVRRQTARYLGDLAELCSDLGGRLMVFGSPQQRSFPSNQTERSAVEAFCDVLEQLLPQLEKHQVVLALEPLGPTETNFLQTAAVAVKIIEGFDSRWLKLHLDVKAMTSESLTVPEIIHARRQALVHFHANDPNLLGPGMGSIEFEPIISALREIDYSGYLSVEVFDFSPGPETIARFSANYLQSRLSRT